MPFLQFSRDKRGYETTSLVHAVRRQGRSRQRILYWFRTPPGVKVGRPALDEEAIRWIEEHNPDIEFNWPQILEAKPSSAPAPEDPRNRRRRDKPERRQTPRPSRPATPAPPPEVAVSEAEPPLDLEPRPDVGDAVVEDIAVDEIEVEREEDPLETGRRIGDAGSGKPVEHVTGREQLTRLRARYAELQARISERGGDAERIETLRSQAESLNPDMWVTEEEARTGVEAFEPKIREIRAALGLRRRRRSRRGGRKNTGASPSGETGD